MEKLPLSVVISVALHAVGVAWAVTHERSAEPEVTPQAAVAIEIVDPPPPVKAPEPIVEVALIPNEPAMPAPAPAPTTIAKRPRVAIATTESTASETGAIGVPDGREPAPRSKLFDMRGGAPAKYDLNLRSDFRDALDHAPKGTDVAVVVPETGRLQPSGGGTFRSNEGVFSAKVEADGSVRLKDSKNLQIRLPDPRKIPKAVAKTVSDWADQPNKIPTDPEAVAVNNHRNADKDTRPDHGAAPVPVVGGGFDITDALMRRKKVDPYASRKLAYLDATRDERVQIGTKHRTQLLQQSTQLVQKHLDRLWASTTDPAARKRGLFELWDDCAETGDATVVEGGRAARAFVLGVIQARFPAGTAHAFTPAEIAAFNKVRQSKAVFEPYR